MNLEEFPKENQARLSIQLFKRAAAMKLFREAQFSTAKRSEKMSGHAGRCGPPVKLHRNVTDIKGGGPPPVKLPLKRTVTKITNLTILPKQVGAGQDGENITGNLEAHMGGFRYTTSRPDFCVDFPYDDLKSAFYQVGEDRAPPLLHFKLHRYIMVGTEKTKQIQFHLMHNTFPTEKNDELSTHNDRNVELKEFVKKVVFKWKAAIVFEEVEKMHEFHGVFPSKASGAFALTFSSLVGLLEEPFVVVRLRDVEIVYLEQVSPDEIDMTLVYEDYDREVLQINSISLKSVARIKAYLGLKHVKYYEKNEKQICKSITEGSAISPQDFINEDGWVILNPEGSDGYETADSREILSHKGDDKE